MHRKKPGSPKRGGGKPANEDSSLTELVPDSTTYQTAAAGGAAYDFGNVSPDSKPRARGADDADDKPEALHALARQASEGRIVLGGTAAASASPGATEKAHLSMFPPHRPAAQQQHEAGVPDERQAAVTTTTAAAAAIAPGAVAVQGVDYDAAEDDTGTVNWIGEPDQKSVEEGGGAEHAHLVSATLVQDDQPAATPPPAGPVVRATRLRPLYDRRVQAAIAVVVLAAIGLAVWALTKPSSTEIRTVAPTMSPQPSASPTASPTSTPTTSVPTISPSEYPTGAPSSPPTMFPTTGAPTDVPSSRPSSSPSASPSSSPSNVPTQRPSAMPSSSPSASPTLTPGTLRVGSDFCSQDPDTGTGGNLCVEELLPCRQCPVPYDRLSTCLSDLTPFGDLLATCSLLVQTESRACGPNIPDCPLDHYCIECKDYAPFDTLEGHVCLAPDAAVQREDLQRQLQPPLDDGYALCEYINAGGTLAPTPSPTAAPTPFPTANRPPLPTQVPTARPTTFPVPGTPAAFPPIPIPSAVPSIAASVVPDPGRDVEGLLSSVSLDGGAALRTPGTPQNAALEELLFDPLLLDYSEADIIQRYAVLVLYFSTDGSQWISSSGWLSDTDVCTWEFIECNVNDAVTTLRIQRNNISGNLPPELYLLGELEFLSLYFNSVVGTIPTELGLLTSLVNLDLDTNGLSGTIPLSLGNMRSVEFIYLNNCGLFGTIPRQLGSLTNLRSLLLSGNFLSGDVPDEVCNLSSFQLTSLSVDPDVDCSACDAFADSCHPVEE